MFCTLHAYAIHSHRCLPQGMDVSDVTQTPLSLFPGTILQVFAPRPESQSESPGAG